MKLLRIPFWERSTEASGNLPFHAIDAQPWGQVMDCNASVAVFHYGTGLCLHYSVRERFIKARKRRYNKDTFRDNCVEFFIAFNEEADYYNFELNCLGSIKAAFGPSRDKRDFLPPHHLGRMEENLEITISNVARDHFIQWDIRIDLDVNTFCFHRFESLAGVQAVVNFTKCGDELPNPHYLSWVDIQSATPDFHQPAFFGEALFV